MTRAVTADARRLDQALVERGLVETRQKAQALIRAGHVRLDGELAEKADQRVTDRSALEVKAQSRFVGRGGEKLDGALDDLGVDVIGRVCLDAGASTGGFTDALLQRGARLVYAVDVGYGQLAWKLRQDERVVVLERTNIRDLQSLPGPLPDLAVGDLSFISLRQVVPSIRGLLAPHGELVMMLKPQFEVGRGRVGKGGVVRDQADRDEAVRAFGEWAASTGLTVLATAAARITGAKGNQEYFLHMRADG
ncbi:MAG TPA: TlyA family RNA methyltransferase [Candidatus Solibacter sp.]|jgi:23S rRNA (cytidine1920-2'-O)/16S rRNA (cytidine1409-2'-O)-methyltransferase|nr:TlyA family RNA methyltransferase [Candidatus Solibacter sp.]